MISSVNKRYWIGIYFGLILSLSVIITLTTLFFMDFFPPKGKALILITILLYAIFIFFFFRKIFKSQVVEITNQGIFLKRKNGIRKIGWDEISSIDHYGRNGFLGMETIKIVLKNQRNPILLYHSHYSNSHDLVQTLDYCYNTIKAEKYPDISSFSPIKINPVKTNEIRFEKFHYITRLPLTSFRSYFPLMGLFFIFLVLTTDNSPASGIAAISVIAALFIIIGVIGIGKIGISNDYMVIQNYYLPFESIFRLNEIQEVFIEFPGGKSPNAVRVITKDGKQKTLRIANYLKKDWLQLEKMLIGKNIKVNNTLYKTPPKAYRR